MIRRFRTPSFKYPSTLCRTINIPPHRFPSSPSLSGSSIVGHSPSLSSSSFIRFPFRNFWSFFSSMAAASSSSASESGLQGLRSLLHHYKLSAYIVPTSDAHQSEYVADCDKRRVFISGFTGSAGVALVVADSSQPSLLWTDGRYWLQASQQLSSSWQLMKAGLSDVPKIEDWLVKNLSKGSRVGVDPLTYSISQYRALQNSLNEAGIEVVAVGDNLVDKVWSDRPALPSHPVFIHPLKYSGESTSSKVAKIRQRLETNHCAAFVVTALDEIAWLFNLRGSDISYNPVFFSYALITQNVCRLYVDEQKVSKEVREFLGNDVEIKSYNSFLNDIKQAKLMLPFFSSTPLACGSLNASAHSKIWLDPAKTNWAIYSCLNADQVFEANSPITILKAIKNEAELSGMREAHRRDAAAMCNFFYWLEEALKKEPEDVTSLTEVSVSDKLEQFRAEQHDFVGLSFETIAGVGSNGAIIHYKAEPESCKRLDKGSMFLLDSGAQFRDGTTDITRTIHLGIPSAYQRRCFTRVLQGHIALADAVFPAGTVGPMVDAFARQYLWKDGLDYVHGTGHGVGAFLNVHEGPHGIGATVRSAAILNTPLQTGMTVSNEPGYYEENQFGIRIESIIIVKNVETPFRVANKQFLGFETITLVPIQRKLIDVTLLSPTEIQWINAYHQKCRESITPLLKGPVIEWLYENTQPIVV